MKLAFQRPLSRLDRALSLFNGARCISGGASPSFDAVIIGGGPVGSSAAVHLALKGYTNVCVIERDPSYKYASSMRSAGGIRQQFSVEENIRMSMYGIDFLKNAHTRLSTENPQTRELEVPDVQFHEIGYLFLASDDKVLLENSTIQQKCGIDWMQTLTNSELQDKFKWLNTDGIKLGSYGTRNEGYFDPWSFVAAMKNKAISFGVTYMKGEVVGGKMTPASSSSSGGRLRIDKVLVRPDPAQSQTIEIGAGSMVVNAAGAWANNVLHNFQHTHHDGTVKIHDIPVRPRKRCIFNVHCPGTRKDLVIPDHTTPLTIDPSGVYFRPEGKGNKFICGVSPAEENDPDCDPIEYARAMECASHHLFDDIIWPALYERVPAFEELKMIASWSGFYEYNTLDQNAIIGAHPDFSNLLLCNGFSGHGLQQSPAAGRAISELIMHNKFTSIDLSRFSFDRILQNKPIFETGIV